MDLIDVVVVCADPSRAERIAAALGRAGRRAETLDSLAALEGLAEAPKAIVVDLDVAEALALPGEVGPRWPDTLLAAFISTPDRERWEAAQASFDLVASRGAVAAQVTEMLRDWGGRRSGERFRLFEAADTAGRIGVVFRGDTPVGPIAVYHIGHQLHAVGDVCPHAGARLSEGETAGTVVTCPLHGSQFDVDSGARVRGPADEPIPHYPLLVEGGVVYLLIEA